MSIFPKKITKDESTIIHVRIKNYDDTLKFLQLRTYIKDPRGKIVKKFYKDFLLDLNSDTNNFKDFYFEFKPSKNCIPGKYVAETDLYYKGEVIHSLTVKNDYFYIERLEIRHVSDDNKNFFIKNVGNFPVNFNLILLQDNNKLIKSYKIDKNSEKQIVFDKVKYDKIFLEYGNCHCQRIYNYKKNKIYIKHYKYSFECVSQELLLKYKNKKIILNNYLAFIWLSCDGMNTVREIANECGFKYGETCKYIKKLKRMGLIKLCRYN